MLTLQRASAGSGKTYTLAKTFLRLFLSVPDEGGRRLRNTFEIKDTLARILAITFTNKATAEMKQRILSALAGLAESNSDEKTVYFSDFIEEFHTTPAKLRAAARSGLETLLGNYSDFKVSTIDTFFQTLLRTFTYETHLNDNYGVEIETDFIYAMAIDALMEEIDAADAASDSYFWFKTLMDREVEKENKWNVFSKNAGNGIYASIKESLKKFESESFKEVRDTLEKFGREHSLAQTYRNMEVWAKQKEREIAAPALQAAQEILDFATIHDIPVDRMGRGAKKAVEALRKGEVPNPEKNPGKLISKPTSAEKKLNAEAQPLIDRCYDEIRRYKENPGTGWEIYRPLFPFLGLMMEAHRHITYFLEENNLIILADTNSILKRIISDDDTPFIYERLGSRLNHLLIDEFQDTSRMQWENIRPLLAEPLSRGEDCLLIGDAKQSIYRFRNADPSIITNRVPLAFPDSEIRGEREEENTNYRSERNIIQFNNLFFTGITRILGLGMENLYSNVAQLPKNKEECGYVRYWEMPEGKKDMLEEIGPLIYSLLKRGYRQKDICFLVRTNEEASKIIATLVEVNESRTPDLPAIEFMSEESLKISTSRAVNTIINCLQNIASASSLKNSEEKEKKEEIESGGSRRRNRVNWEDIRAELPFFMAAHPELSPDEQIESFLNQDEYPDLLGEMVAGMQAATLPALVEAISFRFVSEESRRSEAPYLTAFQDCVLDYCSHYAADIASFLEWWKVKGVNLSIASPEDVDAVKIMTIHKSKGLEFPVVILPDCKFAVTKPESGVRAEWDWVQPVIRENPDIELPEVLPIRLTTALRDTAHDNDFQKYLHTVMTDTLNTIYVAFTRARCELYINISASDTQGAEIIGGAKYKQTARHIPDIFREYKQDGEDIKFPDANLIKIEETTDESDEPDGGLVVEYGRQLSSEEIKKKLHKDSEDTDGKQIEEGYYVNPDIDFLKYREADLPATSAELPFGDDVEDEGEIEEEDDDPRSEGNLLHAAMQTIVIASDLQRALLKLKAIGLLGYQEVSHYREILEKVLKEAEPYGWFDGEKEVMTERPILQRGEKPYRPDRIIVDPKTRKCTIIDYKFGLKPLPHDADGKPKTHSAHRRQVSRYMDLLHKTGLYSSVEGYLWYAKLGHIIKV